MESPTVDNSTINPNYRSSSLSFITFDGNWKLTSLSLPAVGDQEELLEEKIKKAGQERPKVLRSLWHEIGFTFSIAMSQILTVPPPSLHLHASLITHRSTLHPDSPSSCQVWFGISLSLNLHRFGQQVCSRWQLRQQRLFLVDWLICMVGVEFTFTAPSGSQSGASL